MSKGSYFDLDELNGETFQELCAAIVLSEFTKLATPYGSAGRDGGIDARHFGELIDYPTLFDYPHKINSPGAYNIFWVFQAKHTRREGDGDRQSSVVRNLEDEIEKWLNARWKKTDGFIPTCFILMTNVRLTPSTRDELEDLGLLFERFECWDEAKIAGFIALNEGIQRTFFPNKDDRCLEAIHELKSFVKVSHEIAEETGESVAKTKPHGASSSFDFVLAIDKLINYQVVFTSQNNALAELFDLEGSKSESTKEWPTVEIKAKATGLVALAENKTPLEKLVQHIKMKNVVVYIWRQFVGEHVNNGDSVITLKCAEEFKDEVEKISNLLFHVIEGDNRAHVEVDSYLIDLQEKLLKSLESKRYVEFERLLGDLYQTRTTYQERKKEHPNTFYPNARQVGARIAFGWDFISVWEKVYEDVLNIVFKGTHTDDIIERLLRMPFGFCESDALFKNGLEQFKSDFELVKSLFFILKSQGKEELLSSYFAEYEKLCSDISETEFRVESLEDGELFLSILTEVYNHLFVLLKFVLDGATFLKESDVERFMLKIVSANFEGMLSRTSVQIDTWDMVYTRQKEIHAKLSLMKDEFYFAWATYLWSKKRGNQDYKFDCIQSLVSNVTIESIVELYEKTKDKDSGWFDWWFRPESTRRIMAWSSSIDHDIRELLIGVFLTRDFTHQQLLGLELLESEASVNQFLEDVKKERDLIHGGSKGLRALSYVEGKIRSAEKVIKNRIEERISKSTQFSARKIRNIEDSFSERIERDSREGGLYLIQEDSTKSKRVLQTGIYSIMDKIWFLEDQGYVSYAADGYGTQWADSF